MAAAGAVKAVTARAASASFLIIMSVLREAALGRWWRRRIV
jgi:hypothetical protein